MIRVEKAGVCDAAALLEIYAPYVRDTAITFEYDPPSAEEFEERIRTISEEYPYIKAVDEDGSIVGYAYASAFKKRAAYDRSVEVSIYVRRDSRQSGVGRLLYNALEVSLRNMGIINLCACITVPSDGCEEDPSELSAAACLPSKHLESERGLSERSDWDSKVLPRVTWDSFRFHLKMGYTLAGRLHRIGYKFGCWYDIVWMEKALGEHKTSPDEVRIGDWQLPDERQISHEKAKRLTDAK